jgi:two-component system sensor histidine kinase AlgZ
MPHALDGRRSTKGSASISQNACPARLPDFLNLGVWVRALLLVTGLSFVAALVRVPGWSAAVEEFSIVSLHVQPVLVLCMCFLALGSPLLVRAPYRLGLALVLGVAVAAAECVRLAMTRWLHVDTGGGVKHAVLAALAAGAVLFYFHLRSRALSPALAEARLQALQARIRPHFLFNSINAVLSLVRSDPRRAEVALEDMADLFRVLMADNRDLVPLADEVRLCREYLDLEQLRLGARLRVEWHVDNMPADALVPPLVLQPLLENAVYHGIEPSPDVGVVSVGIHQARGRVHVVLRNPYRRDGAHHAGNKMALANIRERLALHFDAEAGLRTQVLDHAYQVQITLPYVRGAAERATGDGTPADRRRSAVSGDHGEPARVVSAPDRRAAGAAARIAS